MRRSYTTNVKIDGNERNGYAKAKRKFIALATKRSRILSLRDIDKTRDHLVANRILSYAKSTGL